MKELIDVLYMGVVHQEIKIRSLSYVAFKEYHSVLFRHYDGATPWLRGPPLDFQGGGGQKYLLRANYLFQPGSAARW